LHLHKTATSTPAGITLDEVWLENNGVNNGANGGFQVSMTPYNAASLTLVPTYILYTMVWNLGLVMGVLTWFLTVLNKFLS